MKKLLQVLFFSLLCFALKGQTQVKYEEGKVTFLSSRNVYVKFSSTGEINPGDTLFVGQKGELIPVLLVENKSSTSTVCKPIGEIKLKKDDVVVAKIEMIARKQEAPQEVIPKEEFVEIVSQEPDEAEKTPAIASPFNEKIKGRFSVGTYNSLSSYRNSTRMRYAFQFRGYNLKNSKFSVDSYITFRHESGEWATVRENLGNALKVFSLSVKYDINENANLTFGRKINPKFSSVGAIDGLQYEHKLGDFQLGAIVGSRPDYSTYGFNPNLLQFGAYVSHLKSDAKGYSQTTLGFMEQRNANNTDRRFVYFQHGSEFIKNVNLFGSMEVDLYQQINNEINTSPKLTNLFLSMRFRVSKAFRFTVSYDNRRQIIYYESYKSFIDQLIDDETRQGFRAGFTYKPVKNISMGVNANTRFQQSKMNPSQNLNANVRIQKVPGINASASLSANFLQNGYLKSQIYGLRLYKDLVPKTLTGELYYRWVDYTYLNSGTQVNQHIVGTSLSMRIVEKLSLNLFYEGVFEIPTIYHRVNARIIKRF